MSFRPLWPPLLPPSGSGACRRQRHVVQHDHDVRRRQLGKTPSPTARPAAEVHVRHRLQQQQLLGPRREWSAWSRPSSARRTSFRPCRSNSSRLTPIQPSRFARRVDAPRTRCCAGCRHTRVQDFQGRRSASWQLLVVSCQLLVVASASLAPLQLATGNSVTSSPSRASPSAGAVLASSSALRPMTSGSAARLRPPAADDLFLDFLHRRHDQVFVLQRLHARPAA